MGKIFLTIRAQRVLATWRFHYSPHISSSNHHRTGPPSALFQFHTMSSHQSPTPTSKAPLTIAPSYFRYGFRKGGKEQGTEIPIRPFDLFMVKEHGGLTNGIWRTSHQSKAPSLQTARYMENNDKIDHFHLLPHTLPISLRTGEKITHFGKSLVSLALIADAAGNLHYESDTVGDDGKTITTSGHHYQEDLQAAGETSTEGDEVTQK
jgi:hypothetical protein